MSPTNFSLRRLFETIALIDMGFGLWSYVFTFGSSVLSDGVAAYLVWRVSGGLIGAGLLNPFHRALAGFVIGFVIIFAAGLALMQMAQC